MNFPAEVFTHKIHFEVYIENVTGHFILEISWYIVRDVVDHLEGCGSLLEM